MVYYAYHTQFTCSVLSMELYKYVNYVATNNFSRKDISTFLTSVGHLFLVPSPCTIYHDLIALPAVLLVFGMLHAWDPVWNRPLIPAPVTWESLKHYCIQASSFILLPLSLCVCVIIRWPICQLVPLLMFAVLWSFICRVSHVHRLASFNTMYKFPFVNNTSVKQKKNPFQTIWSKKKQLWIE